VRTRNAMSILHGWAHEPTRGRMHNIQLLLQELEYDLQHEVSRSMMTRSFSMPKEELKG
jgi:hypothetical protein